MEINLGNERIIELEAALSEAEVRERALDKRVDAFGQLARLFQRPKPEDIAITLVQKRYEPFWFASASARYAYDRRHSYRVEVPGEVQGVTVGDQECPVLREKGLGSVQIEVMDHCLEEFRKEMTLDATSGEESNFSRYLVFPARDLPEVSALQQDGIEAVIPEVRSSFVVRKLVSAMMKTFHADRILEERIDVEEVILYYRPVYAVQFLWQGKNKRQVMEFDALTGEARTESGEIKRQVKRVLNSDDVFDIGADAAGMLIPGASIAMKLGRFAARQVISK